MTMWLARVALVILGAGAALATGATVAKSPSLAAALCLALVLLPAGYRWPTATMAVVLISTQEVPASYAAQSPLLALGHEIYGLTVAHVPVVVLLTAAAALCGFLRYSEGRRRVHTLMTWIALLAVLVTVPALISGTDPQTVLGSDLRPVILLGLGAMCASTVEQQPGGWTTVGRATAAALGLQLVLGLGVLMATGEGFTEEGDLVLYYNSTLPFLAACVALSLVLARRWNTASMLLITVCVAVVLLSGRRNVWVAAVLAYGVALLLSSGRAQNFRRAFIGVVVSTALLLAVVPGLASAITERTAKAVDALAGQGSDASTEGHVSDITFGIRYASDGPFFGYGRGDAYLPDLIKGGDSLYVHNEVVQAWLRYGWIGLFISAVAMAILVIVGARGLRRRQQTSAERAGALVLLMAPVSSMTAPFFQTTQQWPFMVGMALVLALPAALAADDAKDSHLGDTTEGSDDQTIRASSKLRARPMSSHPEARQAVRIVRSSS